MSHNLLETFHALFHCPTAVRVPTLDYEDSDGTKVQMQLVGLPTAPGVIINDGTHNLDISQSRDNCCLESCPSTGILRAQRKGLRPSVRSDFVSIYILPNTSLTTQDELLIDYGGSTFWEKEEMEDRYCCICFSKENSVFHPLATCEGLHEDGRACRLSRHVKCFPSHHPVDIIKLHTILFFCPNHLPLQFERILMNPLESAISSICKETSNHSDISMKNCRDASALPACPWGVDFGLQTPKSSVSLSLNLACHSPFSPRDLFSPPPSQTMTPVAATQSAVGAAHQSMIDDVVQEMVSPEALFTPPLSPRHLPSLPGQLSSTC